MSVLVRYKKRTTLTYSLNAFLPCEGYKVSFNGTEGRIEMDIIERPYVSGSQTDQNDPGYSSLPRSERITLQKLWEKPEEISWETGAGGHGGGDRRLLDDLFIGPGNDPLGRAAGPLDGAKSILVGIAANKSFASGLPVRIDDLCRFDS
jgi:hypothetical protein